MQSNSLLREWHGWLAGMILAIAVSGGPIAAHAQSTETGTPAATASSAWAVNCAADPAGSDGLACRMVQNLFVTETKQRLLSVVIQTPAGTDKPVMTLVLPYGLDFSAGVTASIDKSDPVNLAVKTSDQLGAYANAVLEDDLLDALKNGTEMKVSFRSIRNQAYNVGVSLAGFTAAFRKLTAN